MHFRSAFLRVLVVLYELKSMMKEELSKMMNEALRKCEVDTFPFICVFNAPFIHLLPLLQPNQRNFLFCVCGGCVSRPPDFISPSCQKNTSFPDGLESAHLFEISKGVNVKRSNTQKKMMDVASIVRKFSVSAQKQQGEKLALHTD